MKKLLLIFALLFSLFSFSQKDNANDTTFTFSVAKIAQGSYLCGSPNSVKKPGCEQDSFYTKIYHDSVNLNFISFKLRAFEKIIPKESLDSPFLNDSNKRNTSEMKKYSKYFVLDLFNCSTDTIILTEQDGDLIAIQEAKNAKGKWEPIEYWYYSWCGDSYSYIDILPYHKTSILCPRYYGSFQTKLRVRIKSNKGILISSEFKGSINPNQFKKEKTDRYTKDFINYLKK